MATRDEIRSMIGAEVFDRGRTMIGRVAEVYVDEGTDNPTWILLPAGLHRASPRLAPLRGADTTDLRQGIQVNVERADVDGSPPPDGPTDEPLSAAYVQRLHQHYGHLGEDAMTRSEERLKVGTETQPAGRVRLVKYIDTEYVQVPVRREKVRLEELDGGGEASGAEGGAPPGIEETLHEERLVIDKQTVPVERVRLTTRARTDDVVIEEPVRKEHIDLETDQLGEERPQHQ